MALALFNRPERKVDQLVAIDLGTRTTKAVQLQRKDGKLVLSQYALVDTPISERTLSTDMLCDHLKTVAQELRSKVKALALTVGVNDALVRRVEVPQIPTEDLRSIVKLNSRTYLQQDLPNYAWDCHIFETPGDTTPREVDKIKLGKQKALVVGTKQQTVDSYIQAAKEAGWLLESIVPGLIGPVNAFELTMPEVFRNESVALVDIGFRNSSICLLQNGELIVSRVVALGGDQLTASISESMGISYAEAEGIKVGIAQEVQSTLEAAVMPLGHELRASVDFFEHQQDHTVSQVLVSGGSARSPLIVKALQAELMVECKAWNPLSAIQLALNEAKTAESEQVAPDLAVAVGAALATL